MAEQAAQRADQSEFDEMLKFLSINTTTAEEKLPTISPVKTYTLDQFESAPGFDTSFVTKIREANAKDLEGRRYDQSYNGRLFQFDQDFEQNQATFKELGGASILMPEDQGGFGTGILGVHGNTVYMMTRSDMGEPVTMEIFNMETKTFTPLDTIAIPEYWDGFGMTNRRGCCVEPPTFSSAVSADGGSLFIAGPVDEPKEFTHARLYSMPSKAKVDVPLKEFGAVRGSCFDPRPGQQHFLTVVAVDTLDRSGGYGGRGHLVKVNTRTNTVTVENKKFNAWADIFRYTPNGEMLLVTEGGHNPYDAKGSNTVYVFDSDSLTPIATIPTDTDDSHHTSSFKLFSLFSADGSQVALMENQHDPCLPRTNMFDNVKIKVYDLPNKEMSLKEKCRSSIRQQVTQGQQVQQLPLPPSLLKYVGYE